MSTISVKLTEAGYIGEELFSDSAYELERQCAFVHRTLERKLMSQEEALEAHGVTADQYTAYLLRNTLDLLWAGGTFSWTDSRISIKVLGANLLEFANHQPLKHKRQLKHLAPALRAIQLLSEEMEGRQSLVDE